MVLVIEAEERAVFIPFELAFQMCTPYTAARATDHCNVFLCSEPLHIMSHYLLICKNVGAPWGRVLGMGPWARRMESRSCFYIECRYIPYEENKECIIVTHWIASELRCQS